MHDDWSAREYGAANASSTQLPIHGEVTTRRPPRTPHAPLASWRARLTQVLMLAHARAVERVYAPGGIGFLEVERDFEERAAKSQRTE